MLHHSGSGNLKWIGVMAALALISGAVFAELQTPELAIELPEKYNTPDGMALDADGNIILSCPNFSDPSHPAKILKIDKNDRVTEIVTFPVHPDTGVAGPLGLDVGGDGHLYVADNQAFGNKEHKSRLLRVVMKNGKAVKCEVLVTGFIMANAVSCHGDSVFVTETELNGGATPLTSGVFRFDLDEFDPKNPIELKPNGQDLHLIATLYTHSEDWRVGANGLGFDSQGRMYVCNFGDAELLRFTLNGNGDAISQETVAKGQGMESVDGLKVDQRTGFVYIADFAGNAVHRVNPKTGKVRTLAKNGNTDGKDGLLDRPSEVCLRGGKIYISNIDLLLEGNDNAYDKPHTISVIKKRAK